MKNKLYSFFVVTMLLFSFNSYAANPDELLLKKDAQKAIKMLGKSLIGELKTAMKKGGPIEAIEVCSTKAAKIEGKITSKSGWSVGRTSLKFRSSDNEPSQWERKILKSFAKRKVAGESLKKMDHLEIVEKDGKKEARYMKAIGIPEDKPCLKCHGSKIDSKVMAKIKKAYPLDKAIDYKTGDLRGAFSLSKTLK
jgi:hypothetical protein